MNMTKQAREARKKYARDYYARTKQKQKEYQIRYWEKRAAAENQTVKKEGNNNGEGN